MRTLITLLFVAALSATALAESWTDGPPASQPTTKPHKATTKPADTQPAKKMSRDRVPFPPVVGEMHPKTFPIIGDILGKRLEDVKEGVYNSKRSADVITRSGCDVVEEWFIKGYAHSDLAGLKVEKGYVVGVTLYWAEIDQGQWKDVDRAKESLRDTNGLQTQISNFDTPTSGYHPHVTNPATLRILIPSDRVKDFN